MKSTWESELVDFLLDIQWEQLPSSVKRKAKYCILDTLTVMSVGASIRQVQKLMSGLLKTPNCNNHSSIWGTDLKAECTIAASINAASAQVNELDDAVVGRGVHPGSVVVSTAMAIAEGLNMDGARFLDAVTVGYETMIRLGYLLYNSKRKVRSLFHLTGLAGCFSATATAAKLLGHEKKEFLDALGIAGSITPLSLHEALFTGDDSKILAPAYAAKMGIEAANLALGGITAPNSIIEGEKGLLAAVSDDGCVQHNDPEIGFDQYLITNVHIKLYPSCLHTHSSIDAAKKIVQEYQIDHTAIEQVDIEVYKVASEFANVAPVNSLAAKFSLPYVVAVTLIYGNLTMGHYSPTTLSDKSVLSLMNKIRVKENPDFTRINPPACPIRMNVKFRNGDSVDSYIEYPSGNPNRPDTNHSLNEKISFLTGGKCSLSDLQGFIDDLDKNKTCAPLHGMNRLLMM